jgi:Rho-binding antiterminator
MSADPQAEPDDVPYSPIACGLHDRLEALATLGRSCQILFVTPSGGAREVVDRIVDVFARDGEEFVRTSSGVEIRLDRLERVDGVDFGGGGAC